MKIYDIVQIVHPNHIGSEKQGRYYIESHDRIEDSEARCFIFNACRGEYASQGSIEYKIEEYDDDEDKRRALPYREANLA
jgi:hypothetical protein